MSNLTTKSSFRIKKVLSLLELGQNVEEACKKVGLSRTTFYVWVNSDINNKEQYYSILEAKTSDVEYSLYQSAVSGNTTAMIFWLKNRASDRWSDKQAIEHSGAIADKPDLSKLTDEEIRLRIEIDKKVYGI